MAETKLYGLRNQLDIQQILLEAKHRWLRPAEICEILQNYKKFQISSEPASTPPGGSLFLFDRKVLRYFRKDGHNWRKKKDGKTVKEAHERLKAGSVDVLHCYYAHGEDNENFQRRSYWMLEEDLSHIVLVHYREVKEVVTALQRSHSCNEADAPSPTIRRGTKRKADSSAHIPPRRNYNLRRRNPPITYGAAVRIELSDVGPDDEGDSGEEHDNHSGEGVSKSVPESLAEAKVDEYQEQDSPRRNNDGVSCEVEDNITAVTDVVTATTDVSTVGTNTAVVTQPSIEATTLVNPSSGTREHKSVLNCDKVSSSKVLHSNLDSHMEGLANEWTTRMHEFMAKFDSEVECTLGMDAVVPPLSGNFTGLQGMNIPLELVDPLLKFTESFCEGNVMSLVKKDYTLKKKRELIIDFGKLLFSMEVHQVRNEETFLIWRDACRDFTQAGLDIGFVTESLKEAARHYFGYMMRPEGSDDQLAKFHKLQEEISITKKKLVLLEDELNEARSSLGLDLCDNPKSVLESFWTKDSRAALYLYKKA